VRLTEGDVVDYAQVEAEVIADCRFFDVQRLSYDRMFAGQLTQNVAAAVKGLDVVPVAQTFLGLSPACKELERLLGVGKSVDGAPRRPAVLHGGNPVARWMASCVEVKTDGADNLRPVKPDRAKSASRIDGIQAAVTGLDGWVRRPKPKVYRAAGF